MADKINEKIFSELNVIEKNTSNKDILFSIDNIRKMLKE